MLHKFKLSGHLHKARFAEWGLLCEREEVFPSLASKNWLHANFYSSMCANCGWKQKPLKRTD